MRCMRIRNQEDQTMNTSAAKPVAMENTEKLEIADIFRSYGDDYRQSRSVSHEQAKVMHHIEILLQL